MHYSDEILKDLLINVFDFAEDNIPSLLEQIRLLSNEGVVMLDHLIETRELPEFDYNGLTPGVIKNTKPELSDVEIILCLDGLKRYLKGKGK